MNDKPLPETFHALVASSINEDGVYPHHCLSLKDGKLTMQALMIDPMQVYVVALKFVTKEKPDELIFGLDRFCKEDQGTTLKDCIAGAHWDGKTWRPFIIEYQHEPRIVKPLDWENETWNQFVTNELRQWLVSGKRPVVQSDAK